MGPAARAFGWIAICAATIAAVTSCGGGGREGEAAVQEQRKKTVVIGPAQPNVVANWNRITVDTLNATGFPAVTDEERRGGPDHTTVQLAVYDAVMSIVGTHKPYAGKAKTPGVGASQEAAVASATYHVLKALFPNRAPVYEPQYTSFIASLPAGDARDRGVAIGQETAAQMVALRANDGRWTPVSISPGTQPGAFRGVNPINQTGPFIRPFATTSHDQFRADGPPPLSSTTYAEDFNEVKEMGGASSAKRTAEQFLNARFHSESPATVGHRNYRVFAAANQSIAENARIMAMLWTASADAGNACFESKYYFYFWRPLSAIPLADTDGNAATEADPTWTPSVPTPNHPEYPSAHACNNAAQAQMLEAFYGTKWITYTFSSTVTNTTQTYNSTDDMIDAMQAARIHGGMHFRTATVHGRVLGMQVGKYIAKNYFQPVD